MGRAKRAAAAIVAAGVLTGGIGAALAAPASAHPTKMKKRAVAAEVLKVKSRRI